MAKLKRNKPTVYQQQWMDEQKAEQDKRDKAMLAEISAANADNGYKRKVSLDALESEWNRILDLFMITQIKTAGDRLLMSREIEFVTNVKNFGNLFWKADFADRIRFVRRYRISVRNATTCAGMLGFSP